MPVSFTRFTESLTSVRGLLLNSWCFDTSGEQLGETAWQLTDAKTKAYGVSGFEEWVGPFDCAQDKQAPPLQMQIRRGDRERLLSKFEGDRDGTVWGRRAERVGEEGEAEAAGVLRSGICRFLLRWCSVSIPLT